MELVRIIAPAPRAIRCGAPARHVEPAEPLHTTVGCGLNTREVAHVDDLRVHPPAGLGDQRGGAVKVGRRAVWDHHGVDPAAHVERHNVGALLGEPHGLRAPDPSRRAGDQGDLAF
jgi:hypothetical protein